MAEGKTNWGTLRGYYEADWLGTGITSNNNQSNSYVLRQRVIWAQAETNSHWAFTGGQMWSLATEDKKGISNALRRRSHAAHHRPELRCGLRLDPPVRLPRVQELQQGAFGLAAENPQLLYTASLAGNTPYAVLGSAGNQRRQLQRRHQRLLSLYHIVNYTNQKETDSAGNTIDVAVPVYKTVNGCAEHRQHLLQPGARHHRQDRSSIQAGATMKSSASPALPMRPSIPAKPPTATSTAA
jgi:hypothetical protein